MLITEKLSMLLKLYTDCPELETVYVETSLYCYNKKDLDKVRKQIGGRFTKEYTDDYVTYNSVKYPGFQIKVARNVVCTKIVIGTEAIPERVVPEYIIPAGVKEIVKWKCK